MNTHRPSIHTTEYKNMAAFEYHNLMELTIRNKDNNQQSEFQLYY
jgi:hypothetical protein